MIPSTTKGQRARERMLNASIELMRGSGLSGAGINEIVRASGSPKGSVYHFFPGGKPQVVTEALAAYTESVHEFIDRSMAGEDKPGEKVVALFDALAARLEESGYLKSCAAGAVSLDLDEQLEGLRQAVEAAFADWADVIASHLPFVDRRRARSMADLLVSTIEGAYIRGRAERSGRAFVEAGRWLAVLAEHEAAS